MRDTISRQAAIDGIAKAAREKFSLSDEFGHYLEGLRDADEVVRALPSVQTERKKGAWTKECACEFCGFKPWYERDIHTLSFCPNCGADLRRREDE